MTDGVVLCRVVVSVVCSVLRLLIGPLLIVSRTLPWVMRVRLVSLLGLIDLISMLVRLLGNW